MHFGDGLWNLDRYRELPDATNGSRNHLFAYVSGSALNVQVMFLRVDSHDRDNATSQRCTDQIGRRKGLTPPLVILRGIGADHISRWAMADTAMQLAFVNHAHLDHYSHLLE